LGGLKAVNELMPIRIRMEELISETLFAKEEKKLMRL
jgi:hypothetical protein